MAQIPYRANLSASIYPMTIADGGRTVIVPQADQNFDRRVDPAGEQKDAGIPQALYLENVLPTANGYQSVGYVDTNTAVPMPAAPLNYIINFIEVKFRDGGFSATAGIYSFPLICYADGSFSSGRTGTTAVSITGTAPVATGRLSYAVVAGNCYLYSEANRQLYEVVGSVSLDILQLNNITATVTPANFFLTNLIHSITGSSNYLVAANLDTVFWSSTTTPTDFVASLVSGSGESAPNDTDGLISYLKDTQSGFYVYTQTNAVLAKYTGNARYPWKFIPVINSNTVLNPQSQIYGNSTSSFHYLIENDSQIKLFSGDQGQLVAPEVSEYLSKTTVDQAFNYSTNVFTDRTVQTVRPRVYVFLNRYLIISINSTDDFPSASNLITYSHMIVYDTLLQRYGKLKIDHKFVYTVINITIRQQELLAILDASDNTVKFLHFDIYETDTIPPAYSYIPQTAVFLLGKMQYVRSRKLKLEEVEIEGPQNRNIKPVQNFSCTLLPSLDGRNFDAPIPMVASYNAGGVIKYPAHKTAENHSLLLKGAFSINTIQCKFTVAGDR
jgi:hypothetical protein